MYLTAIFCDFEKISMFYIETVNPKPCETVNPTGTWKLFFKVIK